MKPGLSRCVRVGTVAFGVLAGFLTLGGREAFAQTRPALVKDVNEPGRIPWSTRSQFLPNAGGCFAVSDCANYSDGGSFAIFDLPPVPAGKRWIVTMASGGLANGSGRTNQIELRNNRGGFIFDGLKWIFGGPFSTGTSFSSAIFSQSLFTTFEPGETPTVRVSAQPNLIGYSVLVFTGYLIDATN